jgi:hypothetical protein
MTSRTGTVAPSIALDIIHLTSEEASLDAVACVFRREDASHPHNRGDSCG